MTQTQLSGAWLREEALARLTSAYDAWIKNIGAPTLYLTAKKHPYFTTDEVWEELGGQPTPQERRVMGAVMNLFAKRGFIAKTALKRKSKLSICHAREKTVWRSEL